MSQEREEALLRQVLAAMEHAEVGSVWGELHAAVREIRTYLAALDALRKPGVPYVHLNKRAPLQAPEHPATVRELLAVIKAYERGEGVAPILAEMEQRDREAAQRLAVVIKQRDEARYEASAARAVIGKPGEAFAFDHAAARDAAIRHYGHEWADKHFPPPEEPTE